MDEQQIPVLKYLQLFLNESEEKTLKNALHLSVTFWHSKPDCLEKRRNIRALASLQTKIRGQL